MSNPNTYDDAAYLRACESMNDAVMDLWEAGAEVEDIEDACKTALENTVE